MKKCSFLKPEFNRSSGLEMDPHHSFQGPDVTLASNAMSSLSLSHHHHPTEPDSPDLVSVDGSNVSYTGGGNRYLKNTRQKRQSRMEQVRFEKHNLSSLYKTIFELLQWGSEYQTSQVFKLF